MVSVVSTSEVIRYGVVDLPSDDVTHAHTHTHSRITYSLLKLLSIHLLMIKKFLMKKVR
jgi:hypothetical protein